VRPVIPCPGTRTERGASLSVFVATVVVALLAVAGLVIDGGAQAAAARECQLVASEAARAASDAGALNRAAGLAVDPGAMRAAASEVLATHPRVQGDVQVSGGQVVVSTRATISTTFLSLIRITTLAASGHATVTLAPTG